MWDTWYSPPLWRNSILLRHWRLANPNRCEWEGELTAELIKKAYGEKDGLRESGNRRFYWTFGILKALKLVCDFIHSGENMACGATLKRSMEFEALLGPQSPKRRRCSPLAGAAATPSPQRCSLRPQTDSPVNPVSPQPMSGEHRLTPGEEAPIIRVLLDLYTDLVQV